MSKKSVTRERLLELLDYNPDTGVFVWRTYRGGKIRQGSIAGAYDTYGYRQILIDKHTYRAHRLAWLYVYGVWPERAIDHINGVRDDNRIANLRDVCLVTNRQNQAAAEGAGARFHKRIGKWQSSITSKGQYFHIGYFASREDAHAAYMARRKELHDQCHR